MHLYRGTIQGNSKGFGFFIPEDKNIEDIFVSPDSMNSALDGDKVIVRMISGGGKKTKAEGEVIRIIERKNTELIGSFEKSGKYGFVIPDNNRISRDIYISQNDFGRASHGQKVVAEITDWGDSRKNPQGRIVEILGCCEDTETNIISAIRRSGVKTQFPPGVMEEIKKINYEIPPEETGRRKDFRNEKIITIDGADAKDLDDAVHIKKIKENLFELGVHIADVTYYVKENSNLDKEALERGTSVYYPGTVIPMLPKELSNGACSLNTNEDKLTISVLMQVDDKGKVLKYEIFESIITSKARMTYKDVSDILENEDMELMEKYRNFIHDFRIMQELCLILKKKREKRGAIDFNFQEAKIIVDETGSVSEVKKYDRRISNRIIEEFMILCNETIAENMNWAEVPFVYRIHDYPDYDDVTEFNKFLYNFGMSVKGISNLHPKEFQKITSQVQGKKEETVINTIMLRTMKKAIYSSASDYHFGLASENYCHFTSPIRRYPDLQIHRIIREYINGRLTEKKIKSFEKILPEVADKCSFTERRAEQLEREIEDIRIAEFMSSKIGEEFEGVISGVTNFGVFVELDNTVEGLVHISNITDDYYIFDERNYCLTGERKKKTYKIGDIVNVKLIKVNIQNAEIDFIFLK